MTDCESIFDSTDWDHQMELLQAKHKQQRKELQGQLLAVRKSFTRPDKKKKRELSEQAETAERQLAEEQQLELQQLLTRCSLDHSTGQNSSQPSEEPPATSATVSSNDSSTLEHEMAPHVTGHQQQQQHRVSKAQRRRDRKAEQLRERDERIAEAEIDGRLGVRQLESDAIAAKLARESLQMKHIAPDGNCMYAAVCHQLSGRYTVQQLRQLTADQMTARPAQYRDFIAASTSDSDNNNSGATATTTSSAISDSQFAEHVARVANTSAWGGQVELAALCAALGCQVRVVQSDGGDILLGSTVASPTATAADDDGDGAGGGAAAAADGGDDGDATAGGYDGATAADGDDGDAAAAGGGATAAAAADGDDGDGDAAAADDDDGDAAAAADGAGAAAADGAGAAAVSSPLTAPTVTITYHRHLYGLGAHYNSTQALDSCGVALADDA